MSLQEFLTLFIFYTFVFKNKCMRSLHAQTPERSSFTSEPSHQSVNGRSIRSFKKKKGRSSRALQFTNKLSSEDKLQEQDLFQPTNDASFMKMNIISVMQLGEYPVVTKTYDHEFVKSNLVTNFTQNNAVENYRKCQKKQGSTIKLLWPGPL